MKRIAALLVLLASLLSLPACNLRHIEDTNGESTDLCYFTDEDIVKGVNSYLALGMVTSSYGDYASLRAKKLSGIREICSRSVKADSLTLSVSSGISAGNARIVLVSEGKIVADFDVKGFSERTVNAPNGTYRLLVVGESAEIECEADWTVK